MKRGGRGEEFSVDNALSRLGKRRLAIPMLVRNGRKLAAIGALIVTSLLHRDAAADVALSFYNNKVDPKFETLMRDNFLSDDGIANAKRRIEVIINYYVMGAHRSQDTYSVVDPKIPRIVLFDADKLGCYRLEKYPAATITFYSLYFLLPEDWSRLADVKSCVEKALSEISLEMHIKH